MIHDPAGEITREMILGAIQIHKALGPGLLESAYRRGIRRCVLNAQKREIEGLDWIKF